ncbi:MAG: LysR family transcriptional regulator [Myxococcales bacterium]|nr:LysR family transcriptional regulator [Myxococcales bacterium]
MARDGIPLQGLDLNLLVTLRALLREGSVTRAAERLGQSQPTVSRSLATLRQAFGDPLLVRAGRGMVLTPRAESVRIPLERALAAIDGLPTAGGFDPSVDERTFRITLPDLLGAFVVPRLMVGLSSVPGVRLQVLGSERDMMRALLQDEVDLVVAAPQLDHPELYTRRVGEDMEWSLLFGPSYLPGADVDAETWLASEHVVLAPHGRPDVPSMLDDALDRLGRSRTVRLHVGYLSAIGHTLLVAPLVASLPTPAAQALASGLPLTVVPHPLQAQLPPVGIWMTWHEAHHADPGHAWLRDQVAAAFVDAPAAS